MNPLTENPNPTPSRNQPCNPPPRSGLENQGKGWANMLAISTGNEWAAERDRAFDSLQSLYQSARACLPRSNREGEGVGEKGAFGRTFHQSKPFRRTYSNQANKPLVQLTNIRQTVFYPPVALARITCPQSLSAAVDCLYTTP